MIKKIKIEGFKCFDRVETELNKLNLLTGVNSSGKSSFIQSILLLMQQEEKGESSLNGKYVELGSIKDVKNAITNPRQIKVEIKDKIKEDEIECKFEINMDGNSQIENVNILQNKDFVYLSAERIGVEGVYKQNLMNKDRIGVRGEFAFDYLSKERLNKLREKDFAYPNVGMNLGNQVDHWLNYIMGYYVTAEHIVGTEIVRVLYKRVNGSSKDIQPKHVGTGITYVASVIISALSCKKDSLFVIENPEIHLHPKAQSKLLEFFSFLAARGLQVMIETHSDHIFNGVRKRIKAKDISKEDVSIYFFKQDENYLSQPVKIQIDENGGVRNPEIGLFDQFDDDLDELLGL